MKLKNTASGFLTFPMLATILTACIFTVSTSLEARDCLALNIYHEARGEPAAGQVAVAHVTMNRMADPRWPDNICGVVYQPKQFSWTHMIKDHTPKKGEAWSRALRIAESVMAGDHTDNTDGAVYYHADYVNPVWNRNLKVTTKIGVHVFYKD